MAHHFPPRFACVVTLLALAASAGAAPGDQPTDDADAQARALVEDLYGAEMARVKATPAGTDDAELARRLLEAAGAVADQPALRALLHAHVIELGTRDASGHAAALDAFRHIETDAPARAAPAREALLPVYREAFQRAGARDAGAKALAGRELVDALLAVVKAKCEALDVDACLPLLREAGAVARGAQLQDCVQTVQTAQTDVVALRRTAGLVRRLEAAVEADPANDAARRSLVELFLLQLDDPARAGGSWRRPAKTAPRTSGRWRRARRRPRFPPPPQSPSPPAASASSS